MADEKYKLFRQFMTNELGISRADIEEWTKQSVADQVTKLVGNLPITEIATRAAREAVYAGGNWNDGGELRAEVAKQLAASIRLSLNSSPTAP